MNKTLINIEKNSTQKGNKILRQNETVKIIDMLKKDNQGRG